MIYAFRDCISPFASPFVEIYYERGSRRRRRRRRERRAGFNAGRIRTTTASPAFHLPGEHAAAPLNDNPRTLFLYFIRTPRAFARTRPPFSFTDVSPFTA